MPVIPTFLARLRGKPVARSFNSAQKSRNTSLTTEHDEEAFEFASQIPRDARIDCKIHPDLDSLLEQDSESASTRAPASNTESRTQDPSRRAMSAEFTPLRPSARIGSRNDHMQPVAAFPSSEGRKSSQDVVLEPDQSLSTSSISMSTIQNVSDDTFGQPKQRASRTRNSAIPTTPGDPVSDSETRGTFQRSTPGSNSSFSSNGHRNASSCRNTFGIPSPPSSGFTFESRRKSYVSTETLPPMPPLDHPAFLSTSMKGALHAPVAIQAFPELSSQANTVPTSRLPRHSHSLPSISHGHRVTSNNQSRNRARTQSRTKPNEIFSKIDTSHALHGTDPRRSQHKRSHSSTSTRSSRRISAEFSSFQACAGSGFTGSWEAEFSKAMVRISLGVDSKQTRPADQVIAGTQSGQARGNLSTRTPALGSPFFLQHAHTHHILATSADHKTSPKSYFAIADTRQGKVLLPAMSKNTSRPLGGKGSTPARTGTPSPPNKLSTIPYPTPETHSTSLLAPPLLSFTAATPEVSPITPTQPPASQPAPTAEPLISSLRVPNVPPAAKTSPSSSPKGKRKAEEAGVGGTPPKENREPRATFAIEPRPHRASANSNSTHAPTSYHRKRARLSTTPESRPPSRASSDGQNAGNTGSWSSKRSGRPASLQHQVPPATHQPQRAPSRRSLSQASIPMSALISPHAPSITRSSIFHMHDPRKPAPIQSTSWTLSLPSGAAEPNEGWRGCVERGGSPLHAWLFFIGFLIFPAWWAASFTAIPKTRRLGGSEEEKGVVLDDPQVEFDARSWRTRCRIMAVISLFTYIPFVVLVAVFAS